MRGLAACLRGVWQPQYFNVAFVSTLGTMTLLSATHTARVFQIRLHRFTSSSRRIGAGLRSGFGRVSGHCNQTAKRNAEHQPHREM